MKNLSFTLLLILSALTYSYAKQANSTVYADVNGLVCDFCAQALEKVFSKQSEVASIDVDLSTKVITIHFNEGMSLDDQTITKLIVDSGYAVRAIRYE